MTILAISENQGVKNSIFDKSNFIHFCSPKSQNNFSEKETANCAQFGFLGSRYRTRSSLTLGLFGAFVRSLFYNPYAAKLGVWIEWQLLCSYVLYFFALTTIVLDRIGTTDVTNIFIMN